MTDISSGHGFIQNPPEHPLEISRAHRNNMAALMAYRDKLITNSPEKEKEIKEQYDAMAAESLKSYPQRIARWREWVKDNPHHKDFFWSEVIEHGGKANYDRKLLARHKAMEKAKKQQKK